MMILIFIFIGFTIGRYGDKWGGHLNVPHHWIWGLLMMIFGTKYFFFIGLGLFISDLKDFINLKFWGPDTPKKWRFWDID